MGKTRLEELCYELYGSSKQHDSCHRYAMVRELRELMKQPKASRPDHFERAGNDRMSGEIHEGLVHKAILEEKSTSQFQVSIAHSEIVRSISSGKVDLGLENEDYVVLKENLEQEGDQKNTKTKTDVDGDVERDQKMISNTNTGCAHKVLVKMPSKEKRIKHLKAWKFKFKPASKRSRLRDDKISFVDATVWLHRDLQEIIWDCVNKEFNETVAGCGKTGVDQFKLVHATPRPGVYDRPLQTRVWDSGGSLLESVDEESFGDDRSREVIAELNSYTSLTHLDKSDFRRFDGDKIKEWLFKVEEFFSIDFTARELKVKLASNHFEGQLLRQFQELLEKLSLASMMFEQTFSSITEPKKILPSFFRLKHKWRSRLSHSFSEMKQWMIRRVWKSFGNVMEAHGSKYKGLGCVVEKKKLRNVGDDVTKGKISFLRDVKIILALAVKECRMGKAAERLLPGHYGLLHTFDQCGVNATVIAGTIMQSSLELFHRLRVACLHHTSPGFLYGSLPRPPDERNELVEEATWEFMFGFQKRFPELSA